MAGTTVVQAGKDGKAPKGLSAGTVVNTGGGYFEITSVRSDGSYASKKVSAPRDNAFGVTLNTTSNVARNVAAASVAAAGVSAVEPWQQNMINMKAGGDAAMIAELKRAQGIVDKGEATPATMRYISQVSALINGASLSDVIAGKYDNYGVYSGNWNATKAAENAAAQPTVVDWFGGATGASGLGTSIGTGNGVASYDDPYDNRTVQQALSQGMQQVMPDFSGVANTGIIVLAGAAVLVAVSKLFGK